jgi:hypothetical protein
MVCPPLLWLEDEEPLACLAVAAIVTDGRVAAATMQAPPIRTWRRDMPTLVVASLLMVSPPFFGFKSQVGNVNRSFRRLEIHCPTISQYHWHLKKVNEVNAVFLQERYRTYQHLSAKEMIAI